MIVSVFLDEATGLSTGHLGDWELPALPNRQEFLEGPDREWYVVVERYFYANLTTVLLYVTRQPNGPRHSVRKVRSHAG